MYAALSIFFSWVLGCAICMCSYNERHCCLYCDYLYDSLYSKRLDNYVNGRGTGYTQRETERDLLESESIARSTDTAKLNHRLKVRASERDEKNIQTSFFLKL